MLRSPDGQRAAGGSEQPAESLNLAERLEFRPGYRFKDAEGGRGGTPLHQCMLLDTPASLLALRYLLFRWPGLVYDSYGLGPYAGEHLLHMASDAPRPRTRGFGIFVFVGRHPHPLGV